MRGWMDTHLPWWMLGVIDWPRYRLTGRCFACGRFMVLHSPWALYDCSRTPMCIRITDQGYARLAEEAALDDLPDTRWQLEQVVPVNARGSA